MIKIAHVSDIHIRNLKYHDEYRRVFADFHEKLDEIKPNLVVNTGDTGHTKTQISPEFVDMTSDFFDGTAERADFINVLGNHDLNLMNKDRQDAITPIVENLGNPRVHLWKKSGAYPSPVGAQIVFHNFGISDPENWPKAPYPKDKINIGLFHGSIRNCVTDSLFRMTDVEHDHEIFDGLDYVMMGDIHMRQSFNGGKIWYAGSMIQQNFGEELDKGFLLWEIEDKKSFSVKFIELKGSRKFRTIKLNENLSVPDMQIEKDSRIRIAPPRALTLVEQKAIEKIVKKKFEPYDVITLGISNIGSQFIKADERNLRIENVRALDVQERLIREHFAISKIEISEETFKRMFELNRRLQIEVDKKDDLSRDVNWKMLKIGWNNLFNYGEGNVINFSQIKGLTGIFAPNASGKSSIIDIMTSAAFDSTTKGLSKNVHLINDNKEYAIVIADVIANGERYIIERKLERIKYGQRKSESAKEWGKTTLTFSKVNGDVLEPLVEESRAGTEKNIRRQLGTFDDFMLGHLMAQWNPLDIVACKETERKRIFYRFLDLDIFEQKCKLARDESRKVMEKLAELEENGYETMVKDLEFSVSLKKDEISKLQEIVKTNDKEATSLRNDIDELMAKKVPLKHDGKNIHGEREQIISLQEKINKAKKGIEVLDSSMDSLKSDRDELSVLTSGFEKEKHTIDKSLLSSLEKMRSSVKNELQRVVRDEEDGNKKLKILKQVPCGDQFPTCKFLIDAFESKKSLEGIKEKIKDLEEKEKEYTTQLNTIYVKKDALDSYMELLENLGSVEMKIEKADLDKQRLQIEIQSKESAIAVHLENVKRLEQMSDDIKKNTDILAQVSELKARVAKIAHDNDSKRDSIAHMSQKLGSDQGKLETLQKELSSLNETRELCTMYERYISVMGKDGIPLTILTQKLPLINEEINKILAQTTEFGVFIEHNAEEQSIALYLQYGQYRSRLLELGSGAEKFLASLAIRAALINISNLPKTNMFVIDEGFGKLDPTYMESVQRMFDHLKSVFDHVIVISHTDAMKDMVDNIMSITTDSEGYAHVEIGS